MGLIMINIEINDTYENKHNGNFVKIIKYMDDLVTFRECGRGMMMTRGTFLKNYKYVEVRV